MICQDIEELSGAYVLDAVTPQERQEVEEHLVSCPDCTHLVPGASGGGGAFTIICIPS